jgi:hypothetical protein
LIDYQPPTPKTRLWNIKVPKTRR